MLLQKPPEGGLMAGVDGDLPGGFFIMIARPLVPHGGVGNDDGQRGDGGVQHAAGAEHHQPLQPHGEQLLVLHHAGRRADPRQKEGQLPPRIADPVNGELPVSAGAVGDHLRVEGGDQPVHQLAGKAGHADLGHALHRGDHLVRLKGRADRLVKFV